MLLLLFFLVFNILCMFCFYLMAVSLLVSLNGKHTHNHTLYSFTRHMIQSKRFAPTNNERTTERTSKRESQVARCKTLECLLLSDRTIFHLCTTNTIHGLMVCVNTDVSREPEIRKKCILRRTHTHTWVTPLELKEKYIANLMKNESHREGSIFK